MTPVTTQRRRLLAAALGAGLATGLLAGCGGGGDNAFGNPPTIENPPSTAGGKLSFAYFQRCINPILLAQLQVHAGGVTSTNSCAGSGCHNGTNGTGGALRITPTTQTLDLSDPANTPEVIRASDMYKNFYSSQGVTVLGAPDSSLLLNKPLLKGVLHAGGLIFDNAQDANAKLIAYWISHPAPAGQDEFSAAGNSLFTPPDPNTGSCNTQ
jgi:hypothetical protein